MVLCLLLALAVQYVRPTVQQVAHRHPGDDRPHSHPESFVGAEPAGGSLLAAPANAGHAAARVPGVHTAPSAAPHIHLVPTAHLVAWAEPSLPAIPPAPLAEYVALGARSPEAPPLRIAQARGPPVVPA